MLLFIYRGVHGQASVQCGECTCVHVEPNYFLNCENEGIRQMPQIGKLMQRFISRAYMSGNSITTLDKEYFEHWVSLKYIDLTGNPGINCDELRKIPAHIKVQVECERGTSGEYTNTYLNLICILSCYT